MLPRIRAFAPDLLLISAGFDGADGDDGNAQVSARARVRTRLLAHKPTSLSLALALTLARTLTLTLALNLNPNPNPNPSPNPNPTLHRYVAVVQRRLGLELAATCATCATMAATAGSGFTPPPGFTPGLAMPAMSPAERTSTIDDND